MPTEDPEDDTPEIGPEVMPRNDVVEDETDPEAEKQSGDAA